MRKYSSLFSQLLSLFPRLEFERLLKQSASEYAAKGFYSWGHFVAMLFCQLGQAHSLRQICKGLASCFGKLKHLGLPWPPDGLPWLMLMSIVPGNSSRRFFMGY
jgi:hypothetical protein